MPQPHLARERPRLARQRSRAGAGIAVLIAAILPVVAACGTPDYRVRIQWGGVPELEGSEVEIDGKVVGTLARFGESTQTAFPVGKKGEHRVRIRNDRFDCPETPVDVQIAAAPVMLIVEVAESSASGKPQLVLRR